jgi:hypothetical protein
MPIFMPREGKSGGETAEGAKARPQRFTVAAGDQKSIKKFGELLEAVSPPMNGC